MVTAIKFIVVTAIKFIVVTAIKSVQERICEKTGIRDLYIQKSCILLVHMFVVRPVQINDLQF